MSSLHLGREFQALSTFAFSQDAFQAEPPSKDYNLTEENYLASRLVATSSTDTPQVVADLLFIPTEGFADRPETKIVSTLWGADNKISLTVNTPAALEAHKDTSDQIINGALVFARVNDQLFQVDKMVISTGSRATDTDRSLSHLLSPSIHSSIALQEATAKRWDATTCALFAAALLKKERAYEALNILDQLPAAERTPRFYAERANAFTMLERFEEAHETLAHVPKNYWSIHCHNAHAATLLAEKRFQEALDDLTCVKTKWNQNSLHIYCEASYKRNRSEHAIATLRSYPRFSSDVKLQGLYAILLNSTGKPLEALANLGNCPQTPEVICRKSQILYHNNKIDEALNLLQNIPEFEQTSEGCRLMAKCLARLHYGRDKALETLLAWGKERWTSKFYFLASSLLSDDGKHQEAIDLLMEYPIRQWSFKMFTTALKVLTKLGREAEATHILRQIAPYKKTPHDFRRAAFYYMKQDNIDLSLKILSYLDTSLWGPKTLACAMEANYKNGNIRACVELFLKLTHIKHLAIVTDLFMRLMHDARIKASITAKMIELYKIRNDISPKEYKAATKMILIGIFGDESEGRKTPVDKPTIPITITNDQATGKTSPHTAPVFTGRQTPDVNTFAPIAVLHAPQAVEEKISVEEVLTNIETLNLNKNRAAAIMAKLLKQLSSLGVEEIAATFDKKKLKLLLDKISSLKENFAKRDFAVIGEELVEQARKKLIAALKAN